MNRKEAQLERQLQQAVAWVQTPLALRGWQWVQKVVDWFVWRSFKRQLFRALRAEPSPMEKELREFIFWKPEFEDFIRARHEGFKKPGE